MFAQAKNEKNNGGASPAAFQKAARILSVLAKTNYYLDSPEKLLRNSIRAARVAGIMAEGGRVPRVSARQPLTEGICYSESIAEMRSQSNAGNVLSALSLAVELSASAVSDPCLKKPEYGSVHDMKEIFNSVGETIRASAEKMREMSKGALEDAGKKLPVYLHGFLGI